MVIVCLESNLNSVKVLPEWVDKHTRAKEQSPVYRRSVQNSTTNYHGMQFLMTGEQVASFKSFFSTPELLPITVKFLFSSCR